MSSGKSRETCMPILERATSGRSGSEGEIAAAGQQPSMSRRQSVILPAMDERWRLRNVEIRGGFLDGTSVAVPPGLTCIIGPRGSGKSTLAEAIRYALTGNERADKLRKELFQSNLSRAVINVTTAPTTDGNAYVIRREARQPPLVSTSGGIAIQNVDLDRGTFLPLDGYSSKEIEDLADEQLSGARRALVDDLEPTRMAALREAVQRALRALEANADDIQSCRREVFSLVEEEQSLAHVRELLVGLPEPSPDDVTAKRMQEAARQIGHNAAEKKNVAVARARILELSRDINLFGQKATNVGSPVSVAGSTNDSLTKTVNEQLASAASRVDMKVTEIEHILQRLGEDLVVSAAALDAAHQQQANDFAALKDEDLHATHAARERAQVEADAHRLDQVEQELASMRKREASLLDVRRRLRRDYNTARDAVSSLREEIGRRLESQAGGRVKITVRKNADKLPYRQIVENALKGVGVRQHDSIVDAITNALRPDDLAQIIHLGTAEELERIGRFGSDRSRKILDGLQQNIEPLRLETVPLDDEIAIELDVGTATKPVLRDASRLSRGQKCTALLPLLLARRMVPIVIDQPEDNLDNHFIFNTVVETIKRMKSQRQMIFITHNANIPVLAEADLIVVMDSDGKTGYVKTTGALDECKSEIIDLLEGGRAAFEMRRKRYDAR